MTAISGTGSSGGSQSVSASAVGEANYYYITGKSDNQTVLFQFSPFNQTQAYQKQVVLDNNTVPPSAYPYGFVMNNTRYLLFGYWQGVFKLYQYSSEDKTKVYFKSSNLWNFENIRAAINNNNNYTHDGGPWVLCPTYNNGKLYFTLVWRVENFSNPNDDYVNVRLFQSNLSGNIFQIPVSIPGAIDPTDASHYSDNSIHSDSHLWVGRMFLTKDGRKAFFNVMNTYDYLSIRSGDPFLAPVPNNQDTQGLELTNSAIIWTYVLTADIDSNGEFSSIRQLSSTINQGGINYVCGVSDDGSLLYVAHMNITADFWSNWPGFGPDGVTLDCCFKAPYDVDQWNGTLRIVPCSY